MGQFISQFHSSNTYALEMADRTRKIVNSNHNRYQKLMDFDDFCRLFNISSNLRTENDENSENEENTEKNQTTSKLNDTSDNTSNTITNLKKAGLAILQEVEKDDKKIFKPVICTIKGTETIPQELRDAPTED